MAYATQDIIDWAKICSPLARIDYVKKRALTGQNYDPDLDLKISETRKDVEWQLEQDPTDSDGILYPIGNFLFSLLFPYLSKAQNISGSGGSVVSPTTPSEGIISPIQIRGDDFTSALSWTGANGAGVNVLASYTIQVFWNELSRFLIEDLEWTRTSTGFDIIVNGSTITGFDATGANASDFFFIYISQ